MNHPDEYHKAITIIKEKGGVNELMKLFQVKSVEETFSLIQESIHPLTDRIVLPLHKALNHILAEDIFRKGKCTWISTFFC